VPAGNRTSEALLRVADQLCAELAPAGVGEAPGARSALGEEGVMAGILSGEDESLVEGLRGGLARIAAALGGRDGDSPGRAVSAALDGAEMVIRGELISGHREKLPRLMPSFVFLVTLPIVDQDRALELSRRTEELLEAEPRL
jgi:hypothetical protein